MKTFSMANLFLGGTLLLLCVTTIPISAQDVDLLKEIDSELRKIQESLNDLELKFNNFSSTTISTITTVDPSATTTPPGSTVTTTGSTVTTPESTATTTGSTATSSGSTATTSGSTATSPGSTVTTTTNSALKAESESFTFDSKSADGDAILIAEGTLCVSESKDDLCSRLINVLNDVEGVTDNINNGTITEEQLDPLKISSVEIGKIVDEADPQFISQLDPSVFKSETERIKGKVSNAIVAVDNLIPNESPVLVIVMGVLGGLVFLSLLALAVYIAKQSNQRKKKEQQRKLNETRIPTEPSAEEGNVNKGFVEEEPPKVAVLPRFGPPSGNFYQGSSFKADSLDRREDRRPKTYYEDDGRR
ncbi:poly(A) polymerase-like [Macrobrachium rosenbergii]|uniref:poly(A) polymerase-like n=1 Tax=Macrobrachium rosenbergii TaxID=79674 RepID=UPI0034D48091